MFFVLYFESVTQEFDPWFNSWNTRTFVEGGSYKFWNWFDYRSWNPLARIVGGTVYPGIIYRAAFTFHVIHFIGLKVNIHDILTQVSLPRLSFLSSRGTYASKHIPIIASVSEHQPTAWGSYFFDLHITVYLIPIGSYFCFKNLTDANVFLITYGAFAVYFSGVMVRITLDVAPATSIPSVMGILESIMFFMKSLLSEENTDVDYDVTQGAFSSASRTRSENTSSSTTTRMKRVWCGMWIYKWRLKASATVCCKKTSRVVKQPTFCPHRVQKRRDGENTERKTCLQAGIRTNRASDDCQCNNFTFLISSSRYLGRLWGKQHSFDCAQRT